MPTAPSAPTPLSLSHLVDAGAAAAFRRSLLRRPPPMPILAPVPVPARLKRRVEALVRRVVLEVGQ